MGQGHHPTSFPRNLNRASAVLRISTEKTRTSTGNLNGSSTSESMTALANGHVLIAGGMTFEKSVGALIPIATAELYKP